MAKVRSCEKLLELISRSQLVATEKWERFVETLGDTLPPDDIDALGQRLIDEGLLNRWQLNNLLEGKYKGFTLGKYKLLGHLGTGGMSSVYLAEHPVMERLVAIKVLPKRFVEDPNYLDRFKREARAVAALDHANIVRAFDIDQDGNTHYIVMEYVHGRDLQKMVKEDGPLDPLEAIDYIGQAALGLQHAHDNGLIHRDIKPANCLVDSQGCVKLLDLGLAKFSEDDRPALSSIYDDSVVGTADYLAPEQARNSQKVDSRADIYSLGCTLYFLLTGRPPFPEGSIAERLLKHQTEQPTSIFELRPETPPAIVDLCRRMMIKNAADRIQFASVVADEVRALLAARGRAISFDRQLSTSPPGGSTPRQRGGAWSRSSAGPPVPLGRLPAAPSTPQDGETVAAKLGDTARLRDEASPNDNLTLAPLEESTESAERASTSSSGLHDDRAHPLPRSSSSSIEELEREHFGSGPLDALLEDPNFSQRVQLPKTQLSARKDKSAFDSSWMVIAALAGLALIIGAILLMALTG